MNYELFMAEAIAEARRGGEEGEVPVGAVAVLDDAMIARDHDRMVLQRDPTAHAVLLTLQAAARKLDSRLAEVTIFTTHEPCARWGHSSSPSRMTAGAPPAGPSSSPATRRCRTSCRSSPVSGRPKPVVLPRSRPSADAAPAGPRPMPVHRSLL